MSRLSLTQTTKAQDTVADLYAELERRIMANPPGTCPVDMVCSFVKLCHTQTCGKCTPCFVGLGQLSHMLEKVLNGTADMKTLDMIERTARAAYLSADCAIGFEAARMVLQSLEGYREDYVEHITHGKCLAENDTKVPCVHGCPAHVDVPGYIALVGAGRYADAVRLIRKDNPMPSACAYVCEHPCEEHCRRNIIDDALNIRGLKRYAVDHAPDVENPPRAEETGKKIAVIGGGPSGLTAAYYLQLMGHEVTIFDQRHKLGGMLRYGIPSYRLPREILDKEIESILSTGIKVHTDTSVGEGELSLENLRRDYDAVYLSIGAQGDNKLGIEGEDANGVIPAVQMLREISDGIVPDFTGKRIAVVGGGNVAMDVARTCVRCNAKTVNIIYRRRREDMTAQVEEIDGAVAEGCIVMELISPPWIEKDEHGNVKGINLQQQMIGTIKGGRPAPVPVEGEKTYPCDLVIVAAGQVINAESFEKSGVPTKRGRLLAGLDGSLQGMPGVFAGGDCVTGPATAIKAIAAGKVAAANIDEYLGFHHEISKEDIDIPQVEYHTVVPTGRVTLGERRPDDRLHDFTLVESGMSDAECEQECSRCLRCDFFGYGAFRGGRNQKW